MNKYCGLIEFGIEFGSLRLCPCNSVRRDARCCEGKGGLNQGPIPILSLLLTEKKELTEKHTTVFIEYTVFCGNTGRAAEKSRVGPESLIIESGWPGEGLLP